MARVIASNSSGPPGVPPTLRARVVADDGTGEMVAGEGYCLAAADISAISLTAYDAHATDPTASVATPTITSAALHALRIDPAWKKEDRVGHNFTFVVPGTVFTTSMAGHDIHLVVELTTTGGTPVKWKHVHTVERLVPAS